MGRALAHIKYRASPTLYMFTYPYFIYYRRDKVLASYNNTIHTTRTMSSDTGPACMRCDGRFFLCGERGFIKFSYISIHGFYLKKERIIVTYGFERN